MSSKIAVLIETTADTLTRNGLREQTLIVPDDRLIRPLIFRRTTDGGKGKANSWKQADPVEFESDRVMVFEPVGVYLTAKDEESLLAHNWAPVLAQKALAAFDKVSTGEVSTESPTTILYEVVNAMEDGGYLIQYVHDLRQSGRTTPPAPRPSKPKPVAAPAPVVPAPVVESTAPRRAAEPVPEPAPMIAAATLTVPDKSIAKSYVQRKLSGNKSDYEVMEFALRNKINVLLLGPTGSGKTTLPLSFAAQRDMPFYSVAGNVAMEPSQLFGGYRPDGHGGLIWVDGPITTLVRFGGVLVLDEVNLIHAKILTVLYSLLDARREISLMDHAGESIKAHDDLLVVATGNPGYVGTGILSQAMQDRWAIRQTWDYDPEVEKKLIKSKSLLKLMQDIRSKGDIETPVSTRLGMEFEQIVDGLGWEFAKNNLLERFEDVEERGAVELMLKLSHDSIARELGVMEPATEPVEQPEQDVTANWRDKVKNLGN